MCVGVFKCVSVKHLLLCNPARSIMEAPSRLLPASRAPSGAPPPLHAACHGHVDPLQLVLTDLQTTDSEERTDISVTGWSQKRGKRGVSVKSSLRPDYVVVRLSHLSQIHRTALQLLNRLFGHRHVALCITGGATLRDMNTREELHRRIVVVLTCTLFYV